MDPLNPAIEALRKEARDSGSFGDSARSRLRASLMESQAEPAPFVSLLARGYRWATLAAVPVVLIAAFMVVAGRREAGHQIVRLDAAKVDGEVIFTIHDGAGAHKVVKSSVPNRFNSADAVKVVNGKFTDEQAGGADITFYRFD